MRCETCKGIGWRMRVKPGFPIDLVPCPDCIGGIASCCDTAGAAGSVPKHACSCPACAGSAFCACDNTVLARHAWANHVTRAACQAYLRAGEAAYDQVITNAKAQES